MLPLLRLRLPNLEQYPVPARVLRCQPPPGWHPFVSQAFDPKHFMELPMQPKFEPLVAVARRARDRLRSLMSLPIASTAGSAGAAALAILMSQPAFAALPTIATPATGVGGAAVQQGDWIGTIGAIFVAVVAIIVLVLCAWFFLQGIMGLITKWKDYSNGRAQIGDLKEYFVMVILSSVVVVLLGGYAVSTMS